jgi:hypothetical protein
MRRLVWSLLVIVALLAVLDRVALWAAQHDVSQRLQADAQLNSAPSVHIHGYPFLTQLIGGDYDDVDVVMHGVDAGSVRVDRLTVHVQGAHVSISDVVSQDRSRIHIDHASARLLLDFADIHSAVGGVAAARFAQSALTGVSVSGGDTLQLESKYGTYPLRLSGLPFGIRLTSAQMTRDGIEVTGEARGLVLRT